MGCDGGTIPKRHELVKTKKKPEQLERSVAIDAKWKYCALSNQPLKDPIVACQLGRLYNKDNVIEYLLDKSGDKLEKMSHIKGLKDICALNLHLNPAWENKSQNGGTYIDDQCTRFICPVAGVEMNGRYKFCFLRPCNCVFSDRALKQVDDEVCPTCSKPYSKATDVIVINPDKEDEKINKANMEHFKSLAKLEKKKRKDEKKKFKSPLPVHSNNVPEKNATNGHNDNKADSDSKPSTSKASDKLTSGRVKNLTVTGTVLGAKRKINDEKIFKSDAFKSIFTTHDSAKRTKENTSHWITYNPYH